METSRVSPLDRLRATASIDEDLKQVFKTATALAESQGKDYDSTTAFFQALIYHAPGRIFVLFQLLPVGALPELVSLEGSPGMDESGLGPLEKLKYFFPRINSTMTNLVPKIDPSTSERKISSEDVFVDIARYSGGKSTQRLRSHGVTKEKVDSMVTDLG
eukprot:scaffold2433_cov159-Amphora_coffeaeformis.AAC.9